MSKLGKVMNVTVRKDSWYNALTGLGNSLRDKIKSTQFIADTRMTDTMLENLFHGDDMAERICSALPNEALRKGYFLSLEDEKSDLPGQVRKYERRLKFPRLLKECAIWSRVFGGAVLYLGIDDGQEEDQAVNEEAIKSIRWIMVLDKRTLTPETYYEDPDNDEKYGEPETYRIQKPLLESATGALNESGTYIHETRLIRMDGAMTSEVRKAKNSGWSESVLEKVNETLTQFSTSWQAVGHLMQDASQGVFKLKGLIDMVAGGDKEILNSRMEVVDMGRSVARSILLDAENESFERTAYNFGGVPEVLKALMIRLSAAANMPVIVLMRQSPSGLNATGGSDIQLWYDQVQAYQSEDLAEAIERFYTLVFKAEDFEGEEPDQWEVKFNRLWQMTDKEQAELERTTAEKDRIYIDTGVVLPEEIALNRFRATGFSAETQIDMEAREEMLEAEIDLAKEKAGEEPIPPVMPQPGEVDDGTEA